MMNKKHTARAKLAALYIFMMLLTLGCGSKAPAAADDTATAAQANAAQNNAVPANEAAPLDAVAPKADDANQANDAKNDTPDASDDVKAAADAVAAEDVPAAEDATPNAAADNADAPSAAPPAAAEAKTGIDSIEPLTPEQRQKIAAISWDAAPEVLNAVRKENEGKHYLISDEDHPELFRESISNLGGTYIGVGTEQGYVFVGWQRATLAFLIDYDPWVVEMHSLLIPTIAACENADCVLETFTSTKKGSEFFKAYAAENHLKEREIIRRYNTYRATWKSSLTKVRNMSEKTFMNDPETYEFLRKLAQQGRMVTFQANLLDNVAFKSIGETLNDVGAKVMTLYLSNTEQYWNYNDGFKRNMLGLPYGDGALIMRTQATYPKNNDYRYGIMPAENFKAWLEYPKVRNAKQITKSFKIKSPEDFPFLIDDTMPPM